MMDFKNALFRDRLREALTRHEGFALETRWFTATAIPVDTGGARIMPLDG